jgi:hypothetical protein
MRKTNRKFEVNQTRIVFVNHEGDCPDGKRELKNITNPKYGIMRATVIPTKAACLYRGFITGSIPPKAKVLDSGV